MPHYLVSWQRPSDRLFDITIRFTALWEERILEEDAVERAVARIAGVGDFFARYVEGVEPLPYEELFAAAGVAFASAPREGASVGAKVKMSDGMLVIESVVRGGAGMDAGLLPNDELLALDGTRVHDEASLGAALRGMTTAPAELLIARAGVVKRLSLEPRADPRPRITLQIAAPSELRRQWLGRDE